MICDLCAGFCLYAALQLLICMCWPCDKTDLIMVYDFCMYCLIQFANSSKRLVCNSFFVVVSLSGSRSSLILHLRMGLIVFLPFLVHEEVWWVLLLVLLQRFHRMW
jgi:hypothetical protein